MNIVIYHNPRWGKSRESVKILEKETNSFKIIEYLKEGVTKDKILSLINILGIKPINLIRTNEMDYKNNAQSNMDDKSLLELIEKYPKILQRPIILNGSKGVIGRPPENIYTIL